MICLCLSIFHIDIYYSFRVLSMHIRSLEILFSSSCIKSSSHCLVSGPVLAAAVFARERSATRYITPCVG